MKKLPSPQPSPQLPAGETVIDIRHVNKYYQMGQQRLHVLKDVCLTVQRGSYLAILGPSGSGKSTLMNLIGCMDETRDGEYYLNGLAIHQCKDSQLTQIRNRQIGFIFQKYHLIPKYTVLQNIMMPLLLRGINRREAQRLCMDKISMLGLDQRLEHKPSELSGGQQQRVAIARALVGEPAILLADEPTGALDSKTGQEVLGLFAQLNRMGNTIIMITHDLQVAAHAQRIVRIVDGQLFEGEATPAQG